MPLFPFGETITVHARSAGAEDIYGNDVWADSGPGVDVEGCAVWPRASTENASGHDIVITGLTVVDPTGTAVVAATDQVTARGARYNVVGDVARYRSPLTGTTIVEIQLEKVTG